MDDDTDDNQAIDKEQLPEDGGTPPADSLAGMDETHPTTDTGVDEHEAYDEGVANAASDNHASEGSQESSEKERE